jgi:NAD-dependent SIR2 family protein deacetylase
MTFGDIEKAARLIAAADGLLVTAGAGMGVDSGLPDFRGREGFWRAYPGLARARIDFEAAACPDTFVHDPAMGWGFYGHRLKLYRETAPHAGFDILRRLAERLPHGAFVFTSNVDGQFGKAGFEPGRICEIHGSIHHLQCLEPCCDRIWSAAEVKPDIDEAECRWCSELPHCPRCGRLARPNILMFGDWGWVSDRTRFQQARLDAWRQQVERLVVIELGAGTHVPTVRWFGETLGVPLIRINPTEPEVLSAQALGIRDGALAALWEIEAELQRSGFLQST